MALGYAMVTGKPGVCAVVPGPGLLNAGAALLTALKSVIGTWTEHHLIAIGVLFVISVIFLPRGLAGSLIPALRRVLERRRAP